MKRQLFVSVATLLTAVQTSAFGNTEAVISEINPANCPNQIRSLLESKEIDPTTTEAQEAADNACRSESKFVILLRSIEHDLKFSASGEFMSGNKDKIDLAGMTAYTANGDKLALEIKLEGEYELESGESYRRYSVSNNFGYKPNKHWKLFGEGSIGADSKKKIDLEIDLFGGVGYEVFKDKVPVRLAVSTSLGPQYKLPDGAEPQLSMIKEVLKHRIKVEKSFMEERLALAGVFWFEHPLFTPETELEDAKWLNRKDYLVSSEASVTFKLNEWLALDLTGTYSYDNIPVSADVKKRDIGTKIQFDVGIGKLFKKLKNKKTAAGGKRK